MLYVSVPMKNQVKDDQAFKNMREILTLCLFTCVLDIQREGLSVGSAHCVLSSKITLLNLMKTVKKWQTI